MKDPDALTFRLNPFYNISCSARYAQRVSRNMRRSENIERFPPLILTSPPNLFAVVRMAKNGYERFFLLIFCANSYPSRGKI